ncbi:hypothetical protein Tco_0531277 [Tanacetum coccineum]
MQDQSDTKTLIGGGKSMLGGGNASDMGSKMAASALSRFHSSSIAHQTNRLQVVIEITTGLRIDTGSGGDIGSGGEGIWGSGDDHGGGGDDGGVDIARSMSTSASDHTGEQGAPPPLIHPLARCSVSSSYIIPSDDPPSSSSVSSPPSARQQQASAAPSDPKHRILTVAYTQGTISLRT